MAEIKGQLLGILLVLAVFGVAVTAGAAIMNATSSKITSEIETFDYNVFLDEDLLTYSNN